MYIYKTAKKLIQTRAS